MFYETKINYLDYLVPSFQNKYPKFKYFFRFTIFATFDFLRSPMCYFDHLYIEIYISKNYKNLIL